MKGADLLSGGMVFIQRNEGVFAAAAYLLVIVSLSCLFGMFNGFSGETGLIYPSDVHQGFAGFVYNDPLRKFTSLFYHLSYLLGTAVGARGSFVPYQIVYAALWTLRAVLTYLLAKKLMPGKPALALFAGLFVALHTADAALNWIGQLNQFGFIFFMLLSFITLLRAVESTRIIYAAAMAAVSAGAAYLSLWSYESPLPVMLVFPAAIAILRHDLLHRRLFWVSGVYVAPIIVFLGENAHRYLIESGAGTYQFAVSREDYSPFAFVSDLALHLENSIIFWRWPYAFFQATRTEYYIIAFAPILSAIVVLVIIAVRAEKSLSEPFRIDRRLCLFICTSSTLLIASYVVILLLKDNDRLWRTEFLPSFAAAWFMAAVLYTVIALAPGTVPRSILAIVLFASTGVFATFAGVNSAIYFHDLWERHRTVVSSLVADAPRVADGTLIIIRNVDAQNDPFGHNMWLDLALRLAYPKTKVAGIYFFQDGSPAPGVNIDVDDGEPHILTEGYPTLFHVAGSTISHIIVFDYDPVTGQAIPVTTGPINVGKGTIPAARYHFCEAITGTIPAAIAVRRYGPIETPSHIICPK